MLIRLPHLFLTSSLYRSRLVHKHPFWRFGLRSFSPSPKDSEIRFPADDDDDPHSLSPVIQQMVEEQTKDYENQVREWLRKVVIGLNLCPFAERPFKDGKLKIEMIRGQDEDLIASLLVKEMKDRVETPGTTLVVTPDFCPDEFESFMDFVAIIEQDIIPSTPELVDQVQIAPFHPLFRFEGSGEEDVDNFTNTSPFPIFHILREEEVSYAVDALQGDASIVWKRNVNMLSDLEEAIGKGALETLIAGGALTNDDESKVQEVLQTYRIKLKK